MVRWMLARRCRGRLALVIAALFATSSVALAAAPPGDPLANANGEVWISISTEVLDAIDDAVPTGADGHAVARLVERDGIVATKVPGAMLDVIASVVHERFGRCGGFIAHSSRQEAEAALIRRSRDPLLGASFTIDRPELVAALAGELDQAAILATITSLSTEFPNRYHAHPSGLAAAEWLRDLWLGWAEGHPEVTVELVNHPAGVTPQPSVRMIVAGSKLPDEVIVIGGHLDSTRSGGVCSGNPACVAPGADDDASGVATLSEVARVLLASGLRPERTIHFIGYAAEEVGLRGSNAIANAYAAAGANVVAVLQLDMTGYNGSAQEVVLITDAADTDPGLSAFVGSLVDAYQPTLLRTTSACGYACSDHASWDNAGYPAAFPFEAKFGEHQLQIHSANDTVANLSNGASHSIRFARLAAAFVAELGWLDALFRDGFEAGDTSAWSTTEP